MSEMKHTPGPWVRNHSGQLVGSNGDMVLLAKSGFGMATAFEHPERVANTLLAESAPDLLQALVRMELAFLAVLRGTPVRDADEVIAEATSARAKAQGHAHD